MKVSELTGALLDYWVARAEGYSADRLEIIVAQRSTEHICVLDGRIRLAYSTAPELAHPIMERELIGLAPVTRVRDTPISGWIGSSASDIAVLGETMLEAAMRAFVASKFGETVPDEVTA